MAKTKPKKQTTLVRPPLLVSVHNNIAAYPTIEAIAKRLKINTGQVLQRLEDLPPEWAKKLINRDRSALPISESKRKRKTATREECIEELRRIVLIDEDKVVSRNYFRVHSNFSESAWNSHFGTFHEFKRQAGIVLTRPVHKLEREIAKHASVDHYRELNAEKRDYEGKYLRPASRRFATIMVCSDLHDIELDPFWLRVWIDTVKRVQPDYINWGGDIFDLPEFGKYTVDPRDWDVTGRIKFVHNKIFRPTKEAAPNAQQDFEEGNHELRLLNHLADATPAMRAVLSDLHGFTVAKLLGLDEFEINYIARADLAAWNVADKVRELRKNYHVYDNTFMVHHFPEGRAMGLPGYNGHHHKHIVWSEHSNSHGSYEWHQGGSGHKRQASYCDGQKWNMGFDIVNIDRQKKLAQHDYVFIGDFAVSGGKWYYRQDNEPAF